MLIPVKPFTKGPARYYYEADASQSWQASVETGFAPDCRGMQFSLSAGSQLRAFRVPPARLFLPLKLFFEKTE
jgi:hypothetical protein